MLTDLPRLASGLGDKPALVLVDMIYGFTDPDCELGLTCDKVIEANKELLKLFRQLQLPIFFTTVIYQSEGQATVFRARLPALNVLQPGSRWVEG